MHSSRDAPRGAPEKSDRGPVSVPAVDRAARILQALGAGDLRLIDLARGLHLPKSTTLAILRTLLRHRFVGFDPRAGRYRLGSALARLGALAQTRTDLLEAARPALQQLAAATGETAILHVPDDAGYVILDRVESPHQLRVAAPVGMRLPPFAGAVAKVALAALPSPKADRRLMRRRLPAFTPASLTDSAAYRRALAEVRRRGFATDDEEYLRGVRAVSAPVTADGKVAATLSVVGVKSRLPEAAFRAIARRVVRAAREVSRALAAPEGAAAGGGMRRG